MQNSGISNNFAYLDLCVFFSTRTDLLILALASLYDTIRLFVIDLYFICDNISM